MNTTSPGSTHPMTQVINEALESWPNPTDAWAGECGMFAHVACEIAAERGVQHEFGNAFGGVFDGDWPLVAPPGVTLQKLEQIGVMKSLDHAWLIHDGRHYDAAHPHGVDDPFKLRLFRQVAVELLRRHDPVMLKSLVASHSYWAESEVMFDTFLSARGAEFNPVAPMTAPPAVPPVAPQESPARRRKRSP